ncbi:MULTISPECIES: sulfurtransferase [Nocardia]|uniref:sulfurtransferase n=1 Tax=Nocardia TaxID=1817 RepID=UPI00031789C0|nr:MULTISPECIES: rhodanese-like domain-containing protein [Nocardia]
MSTLTDVVISATQLLEHHPTSGRPVTLLEVHREPPVAAAPRLPGAHVVSLTADLVGPTSPGSGAYPLPTEEQIQNAVWRWGIDADTLVVVYSREVPALAARAWWTLRWAGVPDVRYLDGGLAAWVAAGGDVGDQAPPARTGSFVVTLGSLPVLDTDAAGALARSGVLLDARDSAGYSGASGGGHIPGAVHLPAARNIAPDGLLRAPDALRAEYRGAGESGDRTQWGAYCGGGTAATLDVLALATLGVEAALYPGSFSAWSSDSTRPVASGDEPG